MRDWIRDKACLADALARAREVLREDLTAPRYMQLSDGRLRLEPKAGMKRRLGRSPDDGDALALALAPRTVLGPTTEGMAVDGPADARVGDAPRWGFCLSGVGRRGGGARSFGLGLHGRP